MPLAKAVRVARREFSRPAGQHPDVCLVLSHARRVQINEQENWRLAPADAVLIEQQAPGTPTTNAPQRPTDDASLARTAGGGRRRQGVLPRCATRGSATPSPTRAARGLTLRGRVWLLEAGTQHFNLRHLYVGEPGHQLRAVERALGWV